MTHFQLRKPINKNWYSQFCTTAVCSKPRLSNNNSKNRSMQNLGIYRDVYIGKTPLVKDRAVTLFLANKRGCDSSYPK